MFIVLKGFVLSMLPLYLWFFVLCVTILLADSSCVIRLLLYPRITGVTDAQSLPAAHGIDHIAPVCG
jgi:hypothetical protein